MKIKPTIVPRGAALAAALVVALMLSGCGNKGDLYRDDKSNKAAAASAAQVLPARVPRPR